jgi:hypothetical protein
VRDKVKGAIFVITGVSTWSGLGRKLVETYIFERILHVMNPFFDATIVFLIEYALPVALGAYGIYLLTGLKNKPAAVPVRTWARRQLAFIEPLHLIWIGFSGVALFMAIGFSGLLWQHFKPPLSNSPKPYDTISSVPPVVAPHTVPSVNPSPSPGPPTQARTDELLPGDVAPVNSALSKFHGIIKGKLIGAIEKFRGDLPEPMRPTPDSYSDKLEKLQNGFASLEAADKEIQAVFKDSDYYRADLARIVTPNGYNVPNQNSVRNDIIRFLTSLETIVKTHPKIDNEINSVVLTLSSPVEESVRKYDAWARSTVEKIEQKQRELRSRM